MKACAVWYIAQTSPFLSISTKKGMDFLEHKCKRFLFYLQNILKLEGNVNLFWQRNKQVSRILERTTCFWVVWFFVWMSYITNQHGLPTSIERRWKLIIADRRFLSLLKSFIKKEKKRYPIEFQHIASEYWTVIDQCIVYWWEDNFLPEKINMDESGQNQP